MADRWRQSLSGWVLDDDRRFYIVARGSMWAVIDNVEKAKRIQGRSSSRNWWYEDAGPFETLDAAKVALKLLRSVTHDRLDP